MAESGSLQRNPLENLAGGFGADAQALCKRTWWVFLVGGLAAVVFALLAFTKPVVAWFAVATFFAADVLVDGVFNLLGALQNRDKDGWWIMLLVGALGVLVGGYALLNPLVSMAVFIYLVAFQAVLFGVFTIMLGNKVRAATKHEWVLYLTGALSVVFGLLVFFHPAFGGISVIMMIAGWAFAIGVLKILFAFRVKNLPERLAQA